MTLRTRIATTLTAALFGAGIALAGPAAAAGENPNLDQILYEGPVNELLMPVGDVLDVVDPAGVDEEENSEALTAPAGQPDTAELNTTPPAKKKRAGKR